MIEQIDRTHDDLDAARGIWAGIRIGVMVWLSVVVLVVRFL